MPRLEPGRRAKRWKIKTSPELWHPVLESKHEVSSQLISLHYTRIDEIYGRVARILDKYGVTLQMRLLYRSYAEELYRLSQKYRGKTLQIEANAISAKYLLYGADDEVLSEVAKLFGLEVVVTLKGRFTDLEDTPDSYEGQGGKYVRVKETEDGLEFTDVGNFSRIQVSDVDVIDPNRNLVGINSVAQNLDPDSDASRNLGSANRRYNEVHCVTLYTGDIKLQYGWRLFEKEDGIYLEKDGKVYRIKIEEVE